MDISIGAAASQVPNWVQPALTGLAVVVSATVAPAVMVLQRRAKIRDARQFAMRTVVEFVVLIEMIKITSEDANLDLGDHFPGRALQLMDEHLKAASSPDLANATALSTLFQFRSMIHDLEWQCDPTARAVIIAESKRAAREAYDELERVLKIPALTDEQILAEIAETNPDWKL